MKFVEAIQKVTDTQAIRKVLTDDKIAQSVRVYKKDDEYVVEYNTQRIIRGQKAFYTRYSSNELLNTDGWELE